MRDKYSDLEVAVNTLARASAGAWSNFIQSKIPNPLSLITLTYAPDQLRVPNPAFDANTRHPDACVRDIRMLVSVLNKNSLGTHYRRKCKHSYFSYLFVLESHKNGAPHWHGIVDTWIDYELLHRWWGSNCGFAKIQTIKHEQGISGSNGTPEAVYHYLAKYLGKDGCDHLQVYVSSQRWIKLSSGHLVKGRPGK